MPSLHYRIPPIIKINDNTYTGIRYETTLSFTAHRTPHLGLALMRGSSNSVRNANRNAEVPLQYMHEYMQTQTHPTRSRRVMCATGGGTLSMEVAAVRVVVGLRCGCARDPKASAVGCSCWLCWS